MVSTVFIESSESDVVELDGNKIVACKKMAWGIRNKRQLIRLNLAQGIALALEFKMGGEVLRTVVVREWSELGILGAIIVLRAMLTFLIHWEIKNEKRETQEDQGGKLE